MRNVLFVLLVISLGCAHVSRKYPEGYKDDPETRPMPEAPLKVAETAPAPESLPAGRLGAPESLSSSGRAALAGVLARSVREHVATMLAALPSRDTSICDTPAFKELTTTLRTNFEEISAPIITMEALLGDAGKDVPADEFAALKAAMEKGMFLCPDEKTICASWESELKCYDAVKPHLAAVRAYAYALANALH